MSVSGTAGRETVQFDGLIRQTRPATSSRGEVTMEIRALLQPWRRRAGVDERVQGGDHGSAATDEIKARREEIARMEERALRETESLEVQRGDLERRLRALEDRERNLEHQGEELKQAKRVQRRELERISGLSVT